MHRDSDQCSRLLRDVVDRVVTFEGGRLCDRIFASSRRKPFHGASLRQGSSVIGYRGHATSR